jgi:Protein of unknown function (DUF1822)
MNSSTFELDPQSIWLTITEDNIEQASQQANKFSEHSARPTAYLNLLAQKLLLPYLQGYDSNSQLASYCDDFWSFGINGSKISMNNQYCIILPSNTLDLDEFRIPQEWVDCPDLAAEFYLAVDIDNENKLARIWGYTTFNQLKLIGKYCSRDRSYYLEHSQIHTDINSLWLLHKYYLSELTRPDCTISPPITLERFTNILEDLSKTNLLFLRRSLDFQEWSAILTNPHWCKLLREKRMLATPEIRRINITHLSGWLQNQVEEGWQSVQNLISPNLLGSFMGNQVKRAKMMDLGLDLAGHQVVLMMVVAQSAESVSIQASLYPTGQATFLPPHLKLIISTANMPVFKEVTAQSDDEFIRYRFEASIGDLFDVQVILGENSIQECFQV